MFCIARGDRLRFSASSVADYETPLAIETGCTKKFNPAVVDQQAAVLRGWDFGAAIEDIFQKADITHGIAVACDGEVLTNLRFADDDRITSRMEEQLNTLNAESKEVELIMHTGKTKHMTNYVGKQQNKNRKQYIFFFKWKATSTWERKEELNGRNKEIFLDENIPLSLITQVLCPVHSINHDLWMQKLVPHKDCRKQMKCHPSNNKKKTF
ncbi:hypothetical protein PoB_006993100 [Plakobranchus ocellatus]|uniref:Uncharacterized protein n=1 Tax=Plakobranchus ocellatus TaxID=259542 RepID=A0AAV4DHT7_9GAST|nr:hypothetical protein PoB_006993100 [Plakobranchus ocellatus]